ncbi:CLUMA_CG016572, isoform A [Clunio marinus]|uniref:CLUMA_CG016572, isoform A n=1 Tax=Clunio marinus TaxID=568069 RepID=A0A1J1IX80_9DIPT|nr:CLUMA_CG016572, isoform A [Clunio marinus]
MAHLHITPSDLHRAKIEYKPGHPHSKIYDYTYGYNMNYYQPMIDYLDKRDSASKKERENLQLPHLPWTNERYIKEFDPKNPIKLYNRENGDRLAKKSQDAALRNINNFDVKNSYFLSIPTADATKLIKNLPKQSALDHIYKKDVGKIIEDIKNLEMDAYYRYKEGERLLIEEERENFPISLKRAIRGKSANQIQRILLADSKKNIENDREEEALLFRQCYETVRAKRHARSLSETRPKTFEEVDFVQSANKNVSNTLHDVKKELTSFTNKTEEFLNDTRYRLHLINSNLRKQENLLERYKR